MVSPVLTLNAGSSSIKFALFDDSDQTVLLAGRASDGLAPRNASRPSLACPANKTPTLHGEVERIGLPDAFLRTVDASGAEARQSLGETSFAQAIEALFKWLQAHVDLNSLAVVGHRVVHGGPRHGEPEFITPRLIADLRAIVPLDPSHLPAEIQLIEAFANRFPKLPQVACFDTAFHRDLPAAARMLPIPRRYFEAGIHRYGFHGLSFAFLMEELERQSAASGRVILAHLGSGASMAAVKDGKCIDTTMGLTPTGGLVMGTRTGDLDPGVLLYLARSEGLTTDQLDDLVNRRSGLFGLSETSPDVRDLLSREASDPRAVEAIEVYSYQARKWIGALAASLGGLDTLVFSGGIGEHSPPIRERIVRDLGFLGVHLDATANAANASLISAADSRVAVRVIPTDEERMIARIALRMMNTTPTPGSPS